MAILGAILLDTDTVVGDLFENPAFGHTISASGRTTGKNGLNMNTNTTVKTLASNYGTLFLAFGYNAGGISGSATWVQFFDAGTQQLTFTIFADGSVQIKRGSTIGTTIGTTPVGTITLGTTQHVEIAVTISSTVGTLDLWVNGVSKYSVTGLNTQATANPTVSQFGLASGTNTSISVASDIIWSTTRIGDKKVEVVMPTGAGSHTDFTPSTGSNWQNVDEVPPNTDTDYNESATVNQIDTFTHAAISSSPTPTGISAVIVQVRARNTVAGSGSVAPVLRSGSTDSVGTAVSLNTTYQDFQTVYETDPNTGSAWSGATAVNATEIGYKKTV